MTARGTRRGRSCKSGETTSAANGTNATVKRKFAEENEFVETLAEKSSLTAENAERHRQIEGRAFFANIGGREIYGDALRRGKIERAIFQRGLDALAAFFHGVIGQADDGKFALTIRADVNFDFDEIGVNAVNGRA